MSVEYLAWRGMGLRCKGEYLRRGIKVCSEWEGPDGFRRFLNHVGRKPSPELSLDRIDNDGDYRPGNVRWATASVQQNNTSVTRFIEAFGKRLSISEWSRETGLSRQAIHGRLRQGKSDEEAVSVPSRVAKCL